MRVKWSSIVSWWPVLISVHSLSLHYLKMHLSSYRLGGSCCFRPFALFIGSNALAFSAEESVHASDDCDSSS